MAAYYNIQLLDDIHNYFPALLYDHTRFRTVQDVLGYVNANVNNRFNLFNRAQEQFNAVNINANNQIRRVDIPIPVTRVENPPAPTITRNRATIPIPVYQPPAQQTQLQTQINTAANDVSLLLQMLTGPIQSPQTLVSYHPLSVLALEQMLGLGPMEPVPVVATVGQINAATTLLGATNAHESQTCSICQDTYAAGQGVRRLNQCSHEFHRECIDIWFQGNVHCPVCRFDIRDNSSGSGSGSGSGNDSGSSSGNESEMSQYA
jgi:hypothetical protein